LQGRSALLIGSEKQFHFYSKLLQEAGMKHIYREEAANQVVQILPLVQLVIYIPSGQAERDRKQLAAANIARGCEGRHTPLLIFDLAPTSFIDELAGLLPTVCLYTSDDLRSILI
jgi:hypothetical protein